MRFDRRLPQHLQHSDTVDDTGRAGNAMIKRWGISGMSYPLPYSSSGLKSSPITSRMETCGSSSFIFSCAVRSPLIR